MMDKLDAKSVWKKYQAGLEFNNQISLMPRVEENENFFIGRQWEGVKSNGLPTPVFNFLKQIVLHQVATITSDNIRLNAQPMSCSAKKDKVGSASELITGEFSVLFERNKISTKLLEYARNAAVDGDGCLFSYWDADEDTVTTEILENTRVFFGNPNDKEVQSQPYIIIARRSMLDEVKEYAEENGCEDLDAIVSDDDDNQSRMDALVDDKVTRLLYMWRDRKTNSIHAIETVKNVVIREEYDMLIRRYPITWLPWDYVQDCYHGEAMISGLIQNQKFVNKAYAMAMLSLMMSAFPKTIYDKNRIARWTSQIGAQIGVNGDVSNVARIIEPAQISPQVAQFISSAIEHTRSFTGATAAALGDTKAYNTSAIVSLQRASSIPSEITKKNLYQSIEDLGRIYMEFMAFYYGKRTVFIPAEKAYPADMLAFAGQSPATQVEVEYNFDEARNMALNIKLDVGASAYWSEIASMQTLDNLLRQGHIDIVDYLERVPDGYISKRQELLTKYKNRLEAQNPANAEAAEGMGQTLPVIPGGGNRELQRAIANSF